ncbi:MAG: LamG-like jellyroll fold domain-containing protein [Sandaracinaceae bacterium]
MRPRHIPPSVLVLVPVLSGCVLPLSGLDQGGCTTDTQCMSGEICVAGSCRRTDGGLQDAGDRDAGMDMDAGDTDGGLPDAGSDGGGPDLCTNGVQDPGELGVDCGGACPRCDGPLGVEGMVLWLRADDVAAGAVTMWPDRSAAGNDFVSSAGSVTGVASVSQIQNQAAVSVDVDGQLGSAAVVALASSQVISIVYVAQTRRSVGIMLEASANYRANAGGFLDLRNSAGTGQFDVQHGSDPNRATWQTAELDNEWHWLLSIHDVSLTSGEAAAFVDGTLNGSAMLNNDTTTPFADHAWHLGGRSGTNAFGYDGQIAEVIAYARHLDAADIAHLDAYMQTRYGL